MADFHLETVQFCLPLLMYIKLISALRNHVSAEIERNFDCVSCRPMYDRTIVLSYKEQYVSDICFEDDNIVVCGVVPAMNAIEMRDTMFKDIAIEDVHVEYSTPNMVQDVLTAVRNNLSKRYDICKVSN